MLAGDGGWWRRPRWLVLPIVLPLFLVLGLAAGTLVNLGLTGAGMGGEGAGLLAPASASAADRSAGVPPETCQRMAYIVDTACSLKQRDHDATEIRRCIQRELKYTMWSAYGCG
jgi:hypothetical protein